MPIWPDLRIIATVSFGGDRMLKRIVVFVVVFFVVQWLVAAILGMGGAISLLLSAGIAGFAAWKVDKGTATAKPAKQDESKPALSELPELEGLEPVRGAWEWVGWEYSNFLKVFKTTESKLQAVAIYVTSDALYYFSEDKNTWEEALSDKIADSCKLVSKTMLADIQSVEMESSSQFHGNAARDQYVEPKGNKKWLKARHPSLHWEKHGFFDSNTRATIVYVFTKEGDRIRLFMTWNRDLAVKWRTQVANRIEAALHAAPAIAKPKDDQPDYM